MNTQLREQRLREQEERFRRLDRSLKYCVHCGRRLKEFSYDTIHKSCLETYELHEPLFNNNTGERINKTTELIRRTK